MKTLILILLSAQAYGQIFIEPGFAPINSRMQPMVNVDAGIVTGKVQIASTYSYEFGNKIASYGGHVGGIIENRHGDKLIPFTGVAYLENKGKLEGGNVLMPVIGFSYMINNISWQTRYQGGAIFFSFGYRFINDK